MQNGRQTIQKTVIYDTLRQMANHPTAEEVYEQVSLKMPQISKATVYRVLSQMAEQGKVLRVPVPDGPDSFDHTLRPHCHARCLDCGRVFDVEAGITVPAWDGMSDDEFLITGVSILYEGYCKSCRAKNVS